MRIVAAFLALAALALPVALPAPALADGDPASDVLLLEDSYTPYQPAVSPGYLTALKGLLKHLRAAGAPLKVAVIASPADLGAVPNLFGKPSDYARFLGAEIAFNSKTPLIVVMPTGLGVDRTVSAQSAAVRGVRASGTAAADALAQTAIDAALAFARASGHPLAKPKVAGAKGASSGVSPAVIFAVPVLLLALAGLLAARRREQRPAG